MFLRSDQTAAILSLPLGAGSSSHPAAISSVTVMAGGKLSQWDICKAHDWVKSERQDCYHNQRLTLGCVSVMVLGGSAFKDERLILKRQD